MRHFIIISIFIFAHILLFHSRNYAQSIVNDSSLSAHLISVSFSLQMPGKDLADRFGNDIGANGSYFFKFRNNWILGADFSYIFGNTVKNEEQILAPILTGDGNIINSAGLYTDYYLQERGFYASLRFGKVIPVFKSNPNSGLMIMGGAGLLQHKIRIYDSENNAPQISKEYKKGYELLSNGIGITEFVGYLNLSKTRLLNFYAGLEFIQAWTQNRREYNFVQMGKDNTTRSDWLYGIRIGWIFPIYSGQSREFYY